MKVSIELFISPNLKRRFMHYMRLIRKRKKTSKRDIEAVKRALKTLKEMQS